MIRLLSYIGRFILVSFAFIAAVLAACAFVMLLLWGGITGGEEELRRPLGAVAGLSVPVIAVFAARYAFWPAMAVILLAEWSNRRSWLFHALGGIAIAAAAVIIRANREGLQTPDPGAFAAVLAAGAVGGTVYWLIAGRSSGRMLDDVAERRDSTSASSKS